MLEEIPSFPIYYLQPLGLTHSLSFQVPISLLYPSYVYQSSNAHLTVFIGEGLYHCNPASLNYTLFHMKFKDIMYRQRPMLVKHHPSKTSSFASFYFLSVGINSDMHTYYSNTWEIVFLIITFICLTLNRISINADSILLCECIAHTIYSYTHQNELHVFPSGLSAKTLFKS